MSLSPNGIIDNNDAVPSDKSSEIEAEVKSLYDIPCIGDVLTLMSFAALNVLKVTLSSLKPLLQLSLQSLNIQTAKMSLTSIGLISRLQLATLQVETVDKLVSSLPLDAFSKCKPLDTFFDKTLGFIKSTNIMANFRNLSYQTQQLTNLQDEAELGKVVVTETLRTLNGILEKVEQRIEEATA